MAGLIAAIRNARAGDVIALADGTYLITGKLHAAAQGTQDAPIIVRAVHDKAAHIRSAAPIAFEVSGAHWHFADLDIAGICARDTECEHAFHVIGASTGFVLSGSRIANFNAQIKVNADLAHVLPARGLIESNELFDTRPRRTDGPVAPVNIDNATDWIVRANVIHDFQKDGSGEGSYGAFVKGGARSPIIERNLIVCARDAPAMGHMVGLSFGAGGMDANLCPPHWDSLHPCDPEVSGGVMRNNVVLNCNGDGIALNKARGSAILFNTLVHAAGIAFHGSSSTGLARGNLMTGKISSTQDGRFIDGGNITGVAAAHALFAVFASPARAGERLPSLPGPDALVHDDYCGASRGSAPDFGALQVSSGTCAYGRDAVPTPARR